MKPSQKIFTLLVFLLISLLTTSLSQAAQNNPSILTNIYLPLTFNNFDSRVAQLAFIATDPNYLDQSYIYSINENGSSPTNLTVNPSSQLYFAWSPDGSKIAFNTDWGNDDNIYTMNADGTGLTQLTYTAGADEFPSWSNDSSKLAFISRRSGSNQVYVMDNNGSNVTQLTTLSLVSGMTFWSPVENKIMFYYYGNETNDGEIYVVNSDGSGLQNLTNNAYYDSAKGWSPDGMKILFLSNRDWDGLPNTYDLYTMNSDGTNPLRLTTSGYAGGATWSPDGSRIAYSEYTGSYGISIINPDGSDKTELLCQSAQIDSFDFSWSPDASKIAFTPHSSTQDTQGVYIAAVDNSACNHIFNTLLAMRVNWMPRP